MYEINFTGQDISAEAMRLLVGDHWDPGPEFPWNSYAVTLTHEGLMPIRTGRRGNLSRAEHARRLKLARHQRREIRKGLRKSLMLMTQVHIPNAVITVED